MYNLDRYFDFDSPPKSEIKPKPKKNKQENLQYLVLILLAGTGYYLFVYLNKKREEAKAEINKLLTVNSLTTTDLDANLWKNKDSWEEYLDSLYFTSQINLLVREIKSAIKEIKKQKQEAEINTEEIKATAIKELEDSCNSEELELPAIRNIIKDYSKKIKKSSIDDISTLQKEAIILITEERIKKQGLHWKRKLQEKRSWADKWLNDNIQTFEQAWSKMKDIMRKEPEHFNVAASYKIKFPPSLWNELNEKQKKHKKVEELILGNDVPNYKFSSLIEEWENKVRFNPTRGERDPTTKLDNNALFYGAPRTGKSVMAEKLTYEADTYPLVVIQGSSLTPRKIDYDAGIDPLAKFIFTLCDIDYTLTDEFEFERENNGETRYILFIDEANQITTSTLISKSTELTFLKECMGSDNRINESQNLWIAATNHLDQINEAVYQPGRLSNPLCFSWTLGDFIKYADKVGIGSQFPSRWSDNIVLNDEDNKWVNRFNTMYFTNDFLTFWKKFISINPNAEYEPEKDKEEQKSDNEEKEIKKIKIKWGEMFELFWRLFDSKQLDHFDGKFTNPRNPKIEEIVDKNLISVGNQISKSISVRLKELTETAESIRLTTQETQNNFISTIDHSLEQLKLMLSEVGKKIDN